MPRINLSRQHSIPPETLRQRIGVVEAKLRDQYKANTNWVDDSTLQVDGPGVKGKVAFDAHSVAIDLDLGFMLSPFKGKLEEGLSKELDKLVQPEA